MTADVADTLRKMTVEDLRPIVSQVLGEDVVDVGPFSVAKIGRSVGASTVGIFRVAGVAKTATAERNWSTVIKVLGAPKHPRAGREYGHLKEVDIYRSGVFADLCGGVRAAHCYAIQPRDDVHLVWLEDLSTAPQAPWLPQYYIDTARHLGQFNGYWPEQSLPQWEWLAQMEVSTYFHSWGFQRSIPRLAVQPQDPYIQLLAPGEMANEVLRIWEESEKLYTQADATAKGICHWDCHPKNLFPMDGSGSKYTVAIDWDHVGVGALGVDVGHLLSSPMMWLELSAHDANLLVEPVFNAYLNGLSDARWSGNEDSVRLTYLTRIVHDALRLVDLTARAADDEGRARWMQELLGYSLEEICNQWRSELELAIRYQYEARQLAKQL